MAVSGQDIVDYLLQFKGTPYKWGGNQPGGFDCSGLMQYGFKKFGIDITRTTYSQIGQGDSVSMKGLRVGDLVFFDTDKSTGGPDHVGIYMGNGKMFHTPRPGKSAEVTDITQGYYMDRFMGGRRIAGVVTPGSSSGDLEAPQDVPMSPEELASNYGWSFGFLNGIPELKKLFDQAIGGTWTAEKFQAELRDTKWWKKTSDTARQAKVMETTDPATWKASMEATTVQVQQLAAEIGAAIPKAKLKSIAETVLRTGLEEDGLRNVLGKYVTFAKDGTLKGEAGMHEYTMKQYAAEMGVEIGDQAIKNQAQLVVRKMATTQDFEDQIRQQAISAFPGYADQLDAGATMKDIASPYEQMMAKELELPANPAGLNDQLIRTALNGLNKDGKPVGMSLTDFQSTVRNDPRWAKTSGAQDQAMSVGRKVLTDMGLIAPGGE
jgi:hypothetical protein